MNLLDNIRVLDHHEAQLRRKAKKVKDPKHPTIRVLLDRMKAIAEEWEYATGKRCEGLAAPQIGVSLRVVILRKSDYTPPRDPDRIPNNTSIFKTDAEYLEALKAHREWREAHPHFDNWHELVNPEFVSSEGVFDSDEGCLSVPGKMGKVVRPAKVIFRYTDTKNIRRGPMGTSDRLSAACITHEIDHLMGRLYVDNAIFTLDADKYEATMKARAEEGKIIQVLDPDAKPEQEQAVAES